MGKYIIFFDGVCHLCNRSVQFVVQHDKADKFLFASLQGSKGQQVLKRLNMSAEFYNSFILMEGQNCYVKSTAVLRTLKHLGGVYRLLYAFIIIPLSVRDRIYDFIARNRYKWFGRNDTCVLPSEKWKGKFLDQLV